MITAGAVIMIMKMNPVHNTEVHQGMAGAAAIRGAHEAEVRAQWMKEAIQAEAAITEAMAEAVTRIMMKADMAQEVRAAMAEDIPPVTAALQITKAAEEDTLVAEEAEPTVPEVQVIRVPQIGMMTVTTEEVNPWEATPEEEIMAGTAEALEARIAARNLAVAAMEAAHAVPMKITKVLLQNAMEEETLITMRTTKAVAQAMDGVKNMAAMAETKEEAMAVAVLVIPAPEKDNTAPAAMAISVKVMAEKAETMATVLTGVAPMIGMKSEQSTAEYKTISFFLP